MKSRPGVLLLQLVGVGVVLGGIVWWISKRETGGGGDKMVETSGGVTEEEADILRGQVEYLSDQVQLLQDENKQLLDQLRNSSDGGGEAVDSSALEEGLEARVFEIRELEFGEPIEYPAVSVDEMRGLMAGEMGEFVETLDARRRGWVALGLIEDNPGSDLASAMVDLRIEAEGGVYNAEEKLLAVFEGDDFSKMKARGLRVKALTGALRQENLEPGKVWRGEVTTDGLLTALAVERGDAAFVKYRYELEETMASVASGGTTEDGEALRPAHGVPIFLREAFLFFPQLGGGSFTSEVHRAGGWPAVNGLQERLPQTTWEILHPEVFIEEMVVMKSPEVSGGKGEPYWRDSVGELGVMLLLKQWLPESMALQASDGWMADSLAMEGDLERGSGADTLRWATRWQSEEDAGEFYAAFRKALSNRYEITLREEDNEENRKFKGEGAGRRVSLIWTADGVELLDEPAGSGS